MSRKEEKADTTSTRKLLPRIRRALFQNDDSEDEGELEATPSSSRQNSSRRRSHRDRPSFRVREGVSGVGQLAQHLAVPSGSTLEPESPGETSNPLYETIRKKSGEQAAARIVVRDPDVADDDDESSSSPSRVPVKKEIPVVSVTSPQETPKLTVPPLTTAEKEPHYANLRLKSKPIPVRTGTADQFARRGVTELNELYSDNRALKAQLRDVTVQSSDQIQSLSSERDALRDRVELLHELSYRLNVELAVYRDELAQRGSVAGVEGRLEAICQTLSSGRPLPRWLEDLPSTLAILQSYDDRLRAKTEGSSEGQGNKSAKAIQQEAALVLRTNEQLTRRIEDLEDEARKVHEDHLAKVLQLSAKLEKAELAKKQLELEVGGLQAQYRVVREQYFHVRLEQEHSLPVKEHEAAVQQCYRLFEEAKKKYDKDLRDKDKRFDALSKECVALKHKLHVAEREASSAVNNLESAKKSLRDGHHRISMLDAKAANLEEEKRIMRRKLEELIASCEAGSGVKMQLEGLVGELRSQNASLLQNCRRYPEKLSKLKNKLKTQQTEKERKVTELTRKLADLEAQFARETKLHGEEVERLQFLLRDKENLIRILSQEAKSAAAGGGATSNQIKERLLAGSDSGRSENVADSLVAPMRQVAFGPTFSPLKE